jgi:hypothetical protein
MVQSGGNRKEREAEIVHQKLIRLSDPVYLLAIKTNEFYRRITFQYSDICRSHGRVYIQAE